MIENYSIEDLASQIAKARKENAEIDELESYLYDAQFESLKDDYSKEELYKIFVDIGLEYRCEILTFDEWDEKYIQVCDPKTDEETIYETYGVELTNLKTYADEIANKLGTKRHQHVWTAVDGCDGKLTLLNGWHTINRVYYVLSHNPWGTGEESDKYTYIEVKYED